MNECCPTHFGIEMIKYLVARSQVVMATPNTQLSALARGKQNKMVNQRKEGDVPAETHSDNRLGCPHALYMRFSSFVLWNTCTHAHAAWRRALPCSGTCSPTSVSLAAGAVSLEVCCHLVRLPEPKCTCLHSEEIFKFLPSPLAHLL